MAEEVVMERLALVTGGTRGIGAAVSIALRDAGYRVAANFVGDEARAASFSEKNGIAVYQWDVADGASCRNGLKRVVRRITVPVDVLGEQCRHHARPSISQDVGGGLVFGC